MALEMGLRCFFWQGDRAHETTVESVRAFMNPATEAKPTGEVRVTDPKTGGQKGQKDIQLSYIPYGPLGEVSKVYAYGAKKYARDNYKKGYDWTLCVDAMYRHLGLFNDGEDFDPESKLPHLAHCAWHCLTLLYFMEHYPQGDYRATRRDLQTKSEV